MKSSINDIVLLPSMLEALYKNALVDLRPSPATPAAIRMLGENKQHAVILVNHAAHTFLADEELIFLTRMLQACKLTIADVAIVNLAGGAAIDEVVTQLNPRQLLDFGALRNPGTPFSIGDWQGIPLMTAPPLAELSAESENAKKLKGKLWGGLQKLFGL